MLALFIVQAVRLLATIRCPQSLVIDCCASYSYGSLNAIILRVGNTSLSIMASRRPSRLAKDAALAGLSVSNLNDSDDGVNSLSEAEEEEVVSSDSGTDGESVE